MLRSWGKHRGSLELAFCGGVPSLATHSEEEEEDENDDDKENDLLVCPSTPPRKCALHSPLHHYQREACDSSPPPLRMLSPTSSVSTWSPEPQSPVGWSDDEYDGHQGAPMQPDSSDDALPSFFSPWMCVYDLDAACGSMHNVDDSPQQGVSQHDSEQMFPLDWNLLPSIDLPQWFGGITVTDEPQLAAKVAGGSCSSSENSLVDSPSRGFPFRPRPVYPSSVPTQYFTDFASDHDIEAIYVPVCLSLSYRGKMTFVLHYFLFRRRLIFTCVLS